MSNTHENDVDTLNKFLKGERSAVETYAQCMEKFDEAKISAQATKSALKTLQTSHRDRAARLTQKITDLGGTPVKDSGVWGAFARLVEGGAKVFGQSAAVSVLEEGEDHGNKLYKENLEELSPATRSFVQTELLAEQLRSHDLLSNIEEMV